MQDEEINPAVTTEKMEDIPRFLIPNAIEALVRKHGDAILQIEVERKFHHRVHREGRNPHRTFGNGESGLPCSRRRRRAWLTIISS